MVQDRILKALKKSRKVGKEDERTVQAVEKLKSRKRLSSEEFIRVYDALWKKGPELKYRNPDS